MKKNNSNKVKLGASDKIVRGFGYLVITIYALACIFPFLLFNSHPRFPFCKRVSHFESDLQILYPTFHFCNDFPVFSLAFMI